MNRIQKIDQTGRFESRRKRRSQEEREGGGEEEKMQGRHLGAGEVNDLKKVIRKCLR